MNRLCRYDIRTVIARVNNWAIGFAMFLLGELIPKYKNARFDFFFMKLIVALILNGCF